MRLRTKYALVLLVILVVLATVVLGGAELSKQHIVEREQEDLNQTTTLAAGQVDEAIGERVSFIKRYASEPALDAANVSTADETLDQLTANSVFFAVQIINESGQIRKFRGDITDEQRQAALGKDVSDRSYVERGLASDPQATVARPEKLGEGRYVVTIAAPILTPEGESTGVLAATTRLNLAGFFRATQPLETDSQTVGVMGNTSAGEQVVLSEGPLESGGFENPLTSRASVEQTGWTVVVQRDRAQLLQELQFLQYVQIGSLVVVLLTVLGLGFYEYRTNLQQTQQLLDGFSQLTDGNYDHTLSMAAAEEWEQIGEGYNAMTRGLRERERRLSVLNRVLRHNLQNDTTVIIGWAESLPSLDDKEMRERASEIITEKSKGLVSHGKKARQLEEVMENAEETGQSTLKLVPKVDNALAGYESDYPDVTAERDFPDEAKISAVPGIEFGIQSIIENAFEHNDSPDPEVRVKIEPSPDEVLVIVEDNGPGIPQHERDVLTQEEETDLEHGSGIGLWLSYWAAKKSDGILEFEDLNDGARVTIFLPAADSTDGDATA